MFGLPKFTPRMWLILAHDLIVTVLAVVASFYIRFEDVGLAERARLLGIVLPIFVVYSGFVYAAVGLYKAKWRFTSLPDLMIILRAATIQALTLLVLDYVLLSPNIYNGYFFGKITIVLYWFLQMFFLAGSRVAYRYFRYTRTLQQTRADGASPTLVLGRAADAEVLLRAIESGAVSKIRPVGVLSPSRADRSQAIRGVAVLGDFDDLERIVADLGGRGKGVTRLVLTPSALAPEAAPESILMRARRLGLATSRLPSLDEGGEALRLAPVNVEDLLLRPSVKIDYRRLEGSGQRQVGGRHRRRRLDRRGNLRPARHVRRRPAAGHRTRRAGAERGAGGARRQAGGRYGRWPHRRRARPRAHVSPYFRSSSLTSFSMRPRSSTCRCWSATGRRACEPTSSVPSMSPTPPRPPAPRRW